MEIPRALLDECTAQLNVLSEASQQLVLSALENAEWETVAQLREIMAAVMDQVCFDAADIARILATDMYDDVRKAALGKKLGYMPQLHYDPGRVYGAVKACIQSVVKTGDARRFGQMLADRVDYEIKYSAAASAVQLARMDPLKPRFARVPAGRETCGMCIMLASRGFVYRSAETASHLHPNCDCRVVQGYDGMTVEGYDIERYEKLYADNVVYGKGGAVDVAATASRIEKQLKLELAIDDNIDYSDVPRSSFGIQKKANAYDSKDFLKKGREWRDLFAYDSLALKGHKVAPRPITAPDGYSNIDAFIDGVLVEFKSPEAPSAPPKAGNELDFIDRNLHKAANQFKHQYDPDTGGLLNYTGPVVVVLNLRYRSVDTRAAKRAIRLSMRTREIDTVYLITKQGRVIVIQ